MRPPWHEWSPSLVEQSMSCCSESDLSLPVEICTRPSVEPVVENDQHEPHWPWFLTGVTAPLVRQSTASAVPVSETRSFFSSGFVTGRSGILAPMNLALNSSWLRSQCSLTPMLKVDWPLAHLTLCSLMKSTLSA